MNHSLARLGVLRFSAFAGGNDLGRNQFSPSEVPGKWRFDRRPLAAFAALSIHLAAPMSSAQTLLQVHPLSNNPYDVAVSPDGTTALVPQKAFGIRVYDMHTGGQLAVLPYHGSSGTARAVATTANRAIAIGASEAIILDLASDPPFSLATHNLFSSGHDVGVSPDGRLAVVRAGAGSTAITVYELNSGARLASFGSTSGPRSPTVRSVATTHARAIVLGSRSPVAGKETDSVTILNLTATPPSLIRSFALKQEPYEVVVSPDGTKAVVNASWSSAGGTIEVYDLLAGHSLASIPSNQYPHPMVRSVAATNSRAIVVGSGLPSVRILSLATAATLSTFILSDPHDVVVTPDGTKAIVRAGRGADAITVYDLSTGARLVSIASTSAPSHQAVRSIAVTDSRAIVLGAGSPYAGKPTDSVHIVDLTTSPPSSLAAFSLSQPPFDVVVSPDGSNAVVRAGQRPGGGADAMTMYDLASGAQTASFSSSHQAAWFGGVRLAAATNAGAITLGVSSESVHIFAWSDATPAPTATPTPTPSPPAGDPPAQIANGSFECGFALPGWTAAGSNGGYATAVLEGTCFSQNNTEGIAFDGRFVAAVRSAPVATLDSIGTLTSAPFLAGSAIAFEALSENQDSLPDPNPVTLEVWVLDADTNDVLHAEVVSTEVITLALDCNRGAHRNSAFGSHLIDTSAHAGTAVRVQFRQHTNLPPSGFFTVIDNVRVPEGGPDTSSCAPLPLPAHPCEAAPESAWELDPTFGSGGVVTVPHTRARQLALQPDGKIVVGGSAFDPDAGFKEDLLVARFHADGGLDTSFAGTGSVTTRLGPGYDAGWALATQPDGKLVLAGTTYTDRFDDQDFGWRLDDAVILRYGTDGTVDAGFGDDGIVRLSASSERLAFRKVLIQPDAKVLAGFSSGGLWRVGFGLARYLGDGSVDWAAFTPAGEDGIVVTEIGHDDHIGGLALQPDGKIVAGVTAWDGGSRFALVRYEWDGGLDSTFGSNGIVDTEFGEANSSIAALALQPDGAIVVAGSSVVDGFPRFAVARYDAEGTLDETFGEDGINEEVVGTTHDLALPDDGTILVAGRRHDGVALRSILVRYRADGSVDADFAEDGILTTILHAGASADDVRVVAQPDGKLVVAGSSADGSMLLARYVECATAGGRDSVLHPVRPLKANIRAGKTEISRRIRVKVSNPNLRDKSGHRVRLVARDGTCPAGTVTHAPDFSKGQGSFHLVGGKAKMATVPLRIRSDAFTGGGLLAPHRCHISLETLSEVPDNLDPTLDNNVVEVEVNVIDRNDPAAAAGETVIQSVSPVLLRPGAGAPATGGRIRLQLTHADPDKGSTATLTVSADDGSCPAGTISAIDCLPAPGDQPSTTLRGSSSRRCTATLSIDTSHFATPHALSPGRCVATLSASPDADGVPSNNTTKVVIDVLGSGS